MRSKPGFTVVVLDYTVLVIALTGTCVQLFKLLFLALAGSIGNLRGRADAADLDQLHDLKILAAGAAAALFAAAACAFGSEIATSVATRAELPLRVVVVLTSLGAAGLVAFSYRTALDVEVDRWFQALDLGLPVFAAIVAVAAFGLSRRTPRPSPA